MKNIKNKSINYGLKILTIFAFVMIFVPFNMAAAQSNGYGVGGGAIYGTNNTYYNPIPVYQTPVYVAPQTSIPVVYSNSTNPNRTKTVATQTAPARETATPSQSTTTPATDNTGSDLASNAIFGTAGFLPSGLIQWILFAIFILLIIILIRKVSGAKEKYQTEPLKHD
jgi:hypothetical protein